MKPANQIIRHGKNPDNKKKNCREKAAEASRGLKAAETGQGARKDERQKVEGAREEKNQEIGDAPASAVEGKDISQGDEKRRTEIDAHEEPHRDRALGAEPGGRTAGLPFLRLETDEINGQKNGKPDHGDIGEKADPRLV